VPGNASSDGHHSKHRELAVVYRTLSVFSPTVQHQHDGRGGGRNVNLAEVGGAHLGH
jgi:hypothetical protein